VQQKDTDGSGTVRLFDVDYYGQHVCKKDGIIHPYAVDTTCHSVPIVNNDQSSISMFGNDDVHGIQYESYENLFMAPDMPEYLEDLADIEMARALEITSMNLPLISEDIWS
jgi:hypothetical protein